MDQWEEQINRVLDYIIYGPVGQAHEEQRSEELDAYIEYLSLDKGDIH